MATYRIIHPGEGDVINFPIGDTTEKCTGEHPPGVTHVHAKIYDPLSTSSIPSTHPSDSEPAMLLSGDQWEVTLPCFAGPSPGAPNLLVVWYTYPPPQAYEDLHTRNFKGVQQSQT